MKIAVFGAGAIGGYLAVKLKQAGADVCVIARGPHLAAMRAERPDAEKRGAKHHGALSPQPTRRKKPGHRIM